MSAEEIYARASPAVVTLKTYNDSHEVTFSGSGFILADRFTKPLQVDAEATIFAAPQSKHLGEFYRRREANLTSNLLLPNSNKTAVEEGDEFRKARQRAFDRDWPHLQQVFIVTNYHVIDSAVSIDVKMHDGSTGFVSQVIKEDDSADVAILNAWLPSDKRPAAIALSAVPPNIGAKVFVIGSPLGLENSLSEGLISGIRELDLGHSILQTSAAISHGSSGGPILAANGRVVGIATASHSGGQNLNFAVPAAEVLRLLDKPETPREVWRGRSFTKEESYEFDRTYAALNSKTGGATAAKALLDSKMAALLHGAYGAKMPIKSLEEARQATIEAIRSVPPEFQYLAYFYSGEFQSKEGSSARDKEETPAETAQLARRNLHYFAALSAYRKAAELKPNFAPVYNGMVSVHVSMEDWPAVRRDVDRLVALVPHCVRVYEERAACFKQFGQHEAALKDLKSAADMDPANWIVQMNMADECVALAKYAEAIEAYQRQIRLVPDRQSWLPRYNIGIAYKFSGKYEEAIKAFLHCKAKATDDCPDNFIKDCDEQIEACEAVLRRLGRPSPR